MHRLKYRFGSFAGEGRPCIRASRKWTACQMGTGGRGVPKIGQARPRGLGHGTGREHDSLSDSLGRDSRAVRALAYMTICVADSTGRNGGNYTGQTRTNANGGRRVGGKGSAYWRVPRYTVKHSIPSVEMTVLAGLVENIDLPAGGAADRAHLSPLANEVTLGYFVGVPPIRARVQGGVTKCDTLGGACRPHARGREQGRYFRLCS